MTRITEIVEDWFGLCRKPPVVRAMQADFVHLPTATQEGLPDGGNGGSGVIRRGIGAAFSGMKTLNRNRQLLWFSLLAGLVLAGNAIGQGALRYVDRILQPAHFLAGEGPGFICGLSLYDIASYSLDFLLAFSTLFCLVFLLAGLVRSLSPENDDPASFVEGLKGAKKSLKAIFLWSLILALAGMLLERMYVYLAIMRFPHELGFLYTLGDGFFISTITQFPFNWTLDWNMLTEIPGYGGRSLLLLIYPFGFLETLHFSAITLLLFVMTPVVVPLVILGRKPLREAVAGSFAMMKKIGVELAACATFLAIVIAGLFFVHLLVQAASGMVSPYDTVFFHPPDAWIALALFYNLVLVTAAFIAATAGGIAVRDLYISARTGQITGSPAPELNP